MYTADSRAFEVIRKSPSRLLQIDRVDREITDDHHPRKNREEKFVPRLDALIKAIAVAGDDGLASARLDLLRPRHRVRPPCVRRREGSLPDASERVTNRPIRARALHKAREFTRNEG